MGVAFASGSRRVLVAGGIAALLLAIATPVTPLPLWVVPASGVIGSAALLLVILNLTRSETAARHALTRILEPETEITLEQAAARAAEALSAARSDAAREQDRPWYTRPEAGTLLEALSEATMLVGSDGVVRLANSRCQRLLGLDRLPVGRHVGELITKAELLEEIANARRGMGAQSQIRLPRPDGVLICETAATPIATGEPVADVLVSLRDITQLAGALQLKTDFVANASHELRTPISAIRAAADTLHAAADDGPMRDRLVGMITNHVTHLDELVRDLLDLSKLESADGPVTVKPFALSDLAADLASMYADACDRRHLSLSFELEPALERMRTDRRLLMIIAKNLVENATKYAHEHTTIRVTAGTQSSESVGLLGLELRVSDRGQGIPISQQQRVFERFFQVDSARTGIGSRGTGLGLAIVKHAAKLLEGTVDIDSVWGQGTTMIVRIPACVAADDAQS
ncbi:MAG: ATP-binding protein [Planctomycetota bacterium]